VSLRIRLVLVAAAAVAAAVALASVIVYFVVRDELYGPIDAGLRTAVLQVRVPRDAVPRLGHPNQFIFLGPDFSSGASFPLPFRLVRSNGWVYLPRNLPLDPLVVTDHERSVASGTSSAYFSDAHIAGTAARVYTAKFLPGYAVQVAASLEAADHALSKIRLWLILVALGGTGVAAGAGFLVARAALRPVRRLRDTAEHVRATQDLTRRIEVSGSDELSQLAATFNAMLASLDDTAQRQRQLVQDASHELRTPLTSLRTNIEVLASTDSMPAEERKQLLADVVAQLAEMTELIGELTELARGEGQQTALEEVRLDLVAEEAIRRTARNHPDVPIDAELAPTTAVGAPATLERAIANLLDNAAKWSPAGARIDVWLRNGELSVRDRGPGIADEDLPHIFERFYRATSARSMPGSGLGLAIVKQVAEAHGGTIVAERAPDGGTIMRFTIGNGNGAGDAATS
jgi:two-component system, OmpR family, sensor histidine kinase MprB